MSGKIVDLVDFDRSDLIYARLGNDDNEISLIALMRPNGRTYVVSDAGCFLERHSPRDLEWNFVNRWAGSGMGLFRGRVSDFHPDFVQSSTIKPTINRNGDPHAPIADTIRRLHEANQGKPSEKSGDYMFMPISEELKAYRQGGGTVPWQMDLFEVPLRGWKIGDNSHPAFRVARRPVAP